MYADLPRLRALIAARGLDGLLVTAPENFAYLAGVSGFPVTMWRRAGPASVIVPREGPLAFVVPETLEAALRRLHPDANILSYSLWVEYIDVDPAASAGAQAIIAQATAGRTLRRPETYDAATVRQLVRTATGDAGLLGRHLGVELTFAPADDVAVLQETLGPTVLDDSTALLNEARMLKTPREIELLRRCNTLTEIGIRAALDGLNERTVQADIVCRYLEGIAAAVRAQRIAGFESCRTTVHLGPQLWGTSPPGRTAERGDVIQFDSGVTLHGYASDIGRTFTVGPPSDVQQAIQEALMAGVAAGRAELRPGRRFCDVHRATEAAVRKAGFPSYTRGHFGHSIGGVAGSEEWPFISATEEQVILPGMVLAFEVPYYVGGVGGFQNEDNYLITETGHECFNTLPLELRAVG